RLNTQYPFYKSVLGDSHVIPPGIDIANISRVIDIATGTGAWALDFASQPEVQKRNIQIFACDIDDTKFLQGNKLQVAAKHVSFFQQDVTKPFPDELLGTFDLVNLILLSCALTSQGWKMALQNFRSLLRPGGHLVVRDCDLIMYNHEHPPPPEGQEPDAAAYMQGTSIIANVNRIITGGALRKGFVVGLSYDLSKMFGDASLRVLSSRRAELPLGNHCGFYTGIDGTSLSKYKAASVKNFVQLLDMMSKDMMKDGGLELANGTIISSENERQALMGDIMHFVSEGGSGM
ncbi:S-adenosyl-L-methionine-dependent methyltransferase, partial [Russula emetica]